MSTSTDGDVVEITESIDATNVKTIDPDDSVVLETVKPIEKQSDKSEVIVINSDANLENKTDAKTASSLVDKKETIKETENRETITVSNEKKPNNLDSSIPSTSSKPINLETDVNSDEIYIVESLLKSRIRKNKGVEHKEYLVKWKGYSNKYNTWLVIN